MANSSVEAVKFVVASPNTAPNSDARYRILIFSFLLLLSACTSSVDIPAEMYGVLLHFGEVKGSVSGPSKLSKTFLVDQIVLINKEYSI